MAIGRREFFMRAFVSLASVLRFRTSAHLRERQNCGWDILSPVEYV